jgi:predicted DsbA family dithiol-disulfide isomerase
MRNTLKIDVHFDLICPWCLIGKRHLASALDELSRRRPDVDVVIDWRSHVLLPGTPAHGIPYQAFYERRLGSAEAVAARRAQVREAGRSAGIDFAFERIALMPSTLAAHQFIDCARSLGDGQHLDDFIERLFTAYFLEGRDIGSADVLGEIAVHAGFPDAAIRTCIESPDSRRRFFEKLAANADESVSGVPYFVFANRFALSGAQPPAVLLDAIDEALPQPQAAPATC